MSAGSNETPDRPARFVAYLLNLVEREELGALAALRRSLQEPTGIAMGACPHVVPFLPDEADRRFDGGFTERAFYLIGALFALYPEQKQGASLGHAFRQINGETAEGKKGADNPSTRARFVALLDAHEDDIADHLRHAVSLAQAKAKPIDWVLTLKHLLHWSAPTRWVQRRLAADFWAEIIRTDDSPSAPSDVPATLQRNESETPQ